MRTIKGVLDEAAPQTQAESGASKCRELTDDDMDKLVEWLGKHERDEIGHQGLCEHIVDTFSVSAAAPQAQGVPDGWALVPVEPTREMRKAGLAHTGAVNATYRDMLAAAPSREQVGETEKRPLSPPPPSRRKG